MYMENKNNVGTGLAIGGQARPIRVFYKVYAK